MAMPQYFIKIMPILFVFLWSTGIIGAKMGLPYSEANTFLSVRLVLVLALLWLIILAFKIKYIGTKSSIIAAIVSGGLMFGVYLLGITNAIQFGLSAGLTALIVAMQPILTALIMRHMFQDRLAPRQWLGIMVAFLGVTIVLSSKINALNYSEGLSYLGLGFATLALFGITVGTIYQKRHKSQMDLRAISFWQNIGALLIIAPWALLYDTGIIIWSFEFIFALAWQVIILSIVTTFLLLMLIKTQTSNQVASLFFFVPGVTSVLGWLLFNETLGWFEVAGIIIASYGVFLTRNTIKKVIIK